MTRVWGELVCSPALRRHEGAARALASQRSCASSCLSSRMEREVSGMESDVSAIAMEALVCRGVSARRAELILSEVGALEAVHHSA